MGHDRFYRCRHRCRDRVDVSFRHPSLWDDDHIKDDPISPTQKRKMSTLMSASVRLTAAHSRREVRFQPPDANSVFPLGHCGQ